MKTSPFKIYWIYAFGPIGDHGPRLKDDGFMTLTSKGVEPTLNGKNARWFCPTRRTAAEMRKTHPKFPGKFVEITDAQRCGRGPGNPCKFTARQIEKAA